MVAAIRRLKSSGDRHLSYGAGGDKQEADRLKNVNVYRRTLGSEKLWCLWILRTADLDFCVRDALPSGGAAACYGDPDQALTPPPTHTHTSVVGTDPPPPPFSFFERLQGLILPKNCFMFVYVGLFLFYICVGINFVDLRKVLCESSS